MSADDFSCLLSFVPGEDVSSDNLPDLHSQFQPLPHASSGYKLAWLLFASSERKSSLSGLVAVIYQLLACCCHVNDRGAIQDENRNSESRQHLTASGNSRCFLFCYSTKREIVDLPFSIPSKDMFPRSESMLIVPQCTSCNIYHDFNRDTSVPLPALYEWFDSS